MLPNELELLINNTLPQSKITIMSNDNYHYEAIVVNALFEGKRQLERQRMVFAAFTQQLADGSLHALSLKTYTPSEWQALQTE